MGNVARRSSREGSVYKTAEGRWRAELNVKNNITGEQVRKVLSGKTRAAVVARLEALKSDTAQGKASGRMTVDQFLTPWLAAQRQQVRASTWLERELHTRLYIRPAIGDVRLTDLRPLDVEAMTTRLVDKRGLSPRTAAHVRATLRRALSDAMRDGRVTINVAALAKAPRVESKSLEEGVDYLTSAQLRELLRTTALHPLGPLIAVAATCGVRAGEVLGLRWRDVDLDGRTLSIKVSMARVYVKGENREAWGLAEPKTKRSRRTINLPSAAVAALMRQHELQDTARAVARGAWQDRDELVFTDAVGRPLRSDAVNHEWHRILSAAGLPSVRFHALRHSAATMMLAHGIALKTVSETLGHSSIAITADVYGGVVADQRREAADAVDRALGPRP